MASYENISPFLIARMMEDHVKKLVSDKLKGVMQEVVDASVEEAIEQLKFSAEIYRSKDRFGEDIRIFLVDKRDA